MIIIQTSRIFVVPEFYESSILVDIPIPNKQINYTKKEVKYFIPKFYI
jgi:hypothetical protein